MKQGRHNSSRQLAHRIPLGDTESPQLIYTTQGKPLALLRSFLHQLTWSESHPGTTCLCPLLPGAPLPPCGKEPPENIASAP